MDRMLVIVFDTESKAYEGKEALLALDDDGRISVYACVVISKNADGSTEVEQTLDSVPVETLVGTSLVLEDMASAMGLLVLGSPSSSGDHQGNPTRLNFGRRLHHAIQVRTLSDRADMHTKTLS